MGGCIQKNIFILFSFHNHFNLIASHTNSHSNTNTGLIANNNISNAIRGLMNNIIINNNNNIIICFSLILQQQQESNPRLPLDYTANYDYLILLFLTISSRYLIRYYLSIEQQGIEPYTTLVHLITLTSCLVQLCQAQHFFYGLYTTNTTKGVAPSSSLCRAVILLYYDVLLYASYVKGSLTYNKIKENTNSRNRTHVYRFGICSITTILCSQYAKGCQFLVLI